MIGHSLGAHIAGYVAKSIPGIGRITGECRFETMCRPMRKHVWSDVSARYIAVTLNVLNLDVIRRTSNVLRGTKSFLRSWWSPNLSRYPPAPCVVFEGSLPCSQEPTNVIVSQLNLVHTPTYYLRSIFILPSQPFLGLKNRLLPSGFSTKNLYEFLISSHTYSVYNICLDLIILMIFCVVCELWSSSLWNFLYSPVSSSLMSQYPPRHPVLRHPQP